MESGLSSRRKEIAARGEDHDETLAEIAADLEAQKTLKLGFAGDPRAPQQQQTGDANAAVQAAA
jgi:capsid protein